jgi:glycerophosphoryl diester phosphodiesterase
VPEPQQERAAGPSGRAAEPRRGIVLYGHRGARGEAPENTLPGFAYARRVGVEAFELDVRLSGDHELVVIHDETVDRTTDGTGRVAHLTAAALARLDARAAFPHWPERAGVPTLDEVLATFPDLPAWQIEIKADAPERLERVCARLARLISRYGIEERVVVASFDASALRLMRRAAPELPLAYIGRYDSPSYLETALALRCAGACVPHRTSTRELVHQAQARGLAITGWLGNTPQELELLLDWGVDSITSDYPSVAVPWLRAHAAGRPARVTSHGAMRRRVDSAPTSDEPAGPRESTGAADGSSARTGDTEEGR